MATYKKARRITAGVLLEIAQEIVNTHGEDMDISFNGELPMDLTFGFVHQIKPDYDGSDIIPDMMKSENWYLSHIDITIW